MKRAQMELSLLLAYGQAAIGRVAHDHGIQSCVATGLEAKEL